MEVERKKKGDDGGREGRRGGGKREGEVMEVERGKEVKEREKKRMEVER